MRIILVSQASSRKADPLKGSGGRRLAALAGLDHAAFLKRFERVLLDADLATARDQADQLREKWLGRKVVLLGRGTFMAFRLIETDFEVFKPIEIPPGIEVAVVPVGLTGVSSWWNDQANVSCARDFVLRLNLNDLPRRMRGRPGLRGGKELAFTEDEVAAALVAGRGIRTWAAKVLAEETGHSCTHQTIANYIERFPRLAEIGPQQKYQLCDFAEHNVVKAIEDGDVDSSWRLLRSQMANGRGYALQVNGKVHVSGQVEHRHAHLHAKINGSGLDLSRYTEAQLDAIADFTRALNAPAATGDLAAGPAPGGGVGAGQEGES